MSERNGRALAAFRRLAPSALVVAAFVSVAAAVWITGAQTAALRERAYPIPRTHYEKAKGYDEKALEIQAREAVTSDAGLDVALGQLVASILGLGGVGFTVLYARLAWREAQRSAEAAHSSLESARKDAEEQSRRFERQFDVAAKAAEAALLQAKALVAMERAKMLLEEIKLVSFKDGDGFVVTFRNVGRTYTHVRRGEVYAVNFTGYPDLGFVSRRFDEGAILPGSPYQKIFRPTEAENTAHVYVMWLMHEDAFGETHIDKFGFSWQMDNGSWHDYSNPDTDKLMLQNARAWQERDKERERLET